MTHIPVLLDPVVLLCKENSFDLVIDCTFGGGGHSKAILKDSESMVIGLDMDPIVQPYMDSLHCMFPNRFQGIITNFSQAANFAKDYHNKKVLFLLDLGMSNLQLSDKNRGFSYQNLSSPLNISMSPTGISMEFILNNYSSSQLFNILNDYGEDKNSYAIADNIVKNRPLSTIEELVKVVQYSIPTGINRGKNYQFERQKVLSRIFQAFRIYTNKELENLEIFLNSIKCHKDSVVAIISFHSLEDRIIKRWVKTNCKNVKLIFPTISEIKNNKQSRSAKLRIGTIQQPV